MVKRILLILCLVLLVGIATSCESDYIEVGDGNNTTVSNVTGDGEKLNYLNSNSSYSLYIKESERIISATRREIEYSSTTKIFSEKDTLQKIELCTIVKKDNEEYMRLSKEGEGDEAQEMWYINGIVYSSNQGTKIKESLAYSEYESKYKTNKFKTEHMFISIPYEKFMYNRFIREGRLYKVEISFNEQEYKDLLSSSNSYEKLGDATEMKVTMYYTAEGVMKRIKYETVSETAGIRYNEIRTIDISTSRDIEIEKPDLDLFEEK
ncbi:MAG: hypothetical protein J6D23_01500 [Clostridia bacterium]|nr:hypothetical protein [Clostridia bacterium]